MVLWFARGIRRGVITTRYPLATPDTWSVDLPSPPVFDPGLLSVELADALVAVCPSGALRREGTRMLYDVGACTACRRCLRIAGEAAHPSGQFELAVPRREQLIKSIPLRGGRNGDE